VAHLPGTEHEIRALVPAADEAYRYMRDDVLRGGLVDPGLKELCFRYLAGDPEVADPSRFEGRREGLALRWAYAIAWDSSAADDELWAALHAEFTEPELVELGCAIGFENGQQHWRRTVGLPSRDPQLAS
jgi:alkylhydroperoxidase family enzyme